MIIGDLLKAEPHLTLPLEERGGNFNSFFSKGGVGKGKNPTLTPPLEERGRGLLTPLLLLKGRSWEVRTPKLPPPAKGRLGGVNVCI